MVPRVELQLAANDLTVENFLKVVNADLTTGRHWLLDHEDRHHVTLVWFLRIELLSSCLTASVCI